MHTTTTTANTKGIATLRPLTQIERLTQGRQPFARLTRPFRNRKGYSRKGKIALD